MLKVQVACGIEFQPLGENNIYVECSIELVYQEILLVVAVSTKRVAL